MFKGFFSCFHRKGTKKSDRYVAPAGAKYETLNISGHHNSSTTVILERAEGPSSLQATQSSSVPRSLPFRFRSWSLVAGSRYSRLLL